MINLAGLSLGLAAFIYVLVLVGHETRFDNFYPAGDRIYRVSSTLVNGDKRMSTGFCNAPVGPSVTSDIPGIEAFCRVSAENLQKLIIGTDLRKGHSVNTQTAETTFDSLNRLAINLNEQAAWAG